MKQGKDEKETDLGREWESITTTTVFVVSFLKIFLMATPYICPQKNPVSFKTYVSQKLDLNQLIYLKIESANIILSSSMIGLK